MSTYVVTGATGFIGSALTRRLLDEGHSVRQVARAPSPALFTHERASSHVASLGDPNALAEIARGAEVLYHCAGEHSPRAPREAYAWINVAGTENVLNAARHAGVRRVIHLSCADATLVNNDRMNWKESHAMADQPLDALCRSKLLADELAVQASDRQLQVCVLRPAWVWGPGDRRTLPVLCREDQRGRVRLCGSGENLVPTVYIDNLLHALRLADSGERVAGKVFHVLDGEVHTAHEFIGALCRSLGLREPARGVYALSYLRAWLNELLGLPGFARTEVVRRGRSALFDGMAAANELGYAPKVTFDQGMQALATWAVIIGGRDAIARMRPSAATRGDVEAMVRIADAT
jgi:nucleoside-diphosphate-sugar epimerase